MKRIFLIILLLSLVVFTGCSSSDSGGDASPAANYTGHYKVVEYSDWDDDDVNDDILGDLFIMQDGSHAGMTYEGFDYTVTETTCSGEIKLGIQLNNMLIGTGVGKVKGRKIDTQWEAGAFTRLEFSADGSSFMAYGDVSFAGIKK